MKDSSSCTKGCSRNQAREDLPGASINAADKDKVSPELVKERTGTLNNNPRNNDDKMPG